jgi:hypothetical protein
MKKEIIKQIITGAFVFVVIGSLLGSMVYFLPKRNNEVPLQVRKGLEYINELLNLQGQNATLVSWSQEGGLYKIELKIGDQQFQSFVSKDGKYLFPYGIDLTKKPEQITQNQESENQVNNIEKREKPDVKLFVMSYCPYGLQMEKALLPVWKLLKEKAEIGIYFVDYIMHKRIEMEENLRQYCIQKEEKDKFISYLECFVKDGDFEKCLKEANIDLAKLENCQKITDKEFKISENWKDEGYPPFNVHRDLNEKYNVQGSPTLVINDKVVNVNRSPEKVKQIICSAFLTPPPECNQTLSDEVFSPGFGMVTSTLAGGSCQ